MSNRVNLTLDVTKTGIQNPLIKVRQGDGGFETLRTTVTSNGEPLDLQGWTITFMGTTAGDHKIVDGNVTLVEAPNGIFDYTPSKAWGMDIGEFKIAYFNFVKGDGSASSANFRVSVIEAVDLTQEEAQNYISVVDATITEVREHLESSLADVTQSIAATSSAAGSLSVQVSSAVNQVNSVASSAVDNVNSVASSAASYIAVNDAQLVHKNGTETIAGDKTFTGNVKFTGTLDDATINKNEVTINVDDAHKVTYNGSNVLSFDVNSTPYGDWITSGFTPGGKISASIVTSYFPTVTATNGIRWGIQFYTASSYISSAYAPYVSSKHEEQYYKMEDITVPAETARIRIRFYISAADYGVMQITQPMINAGSTVNNYTSGDGNLVKNPEFTDGTSWFSNTTETAPLTTSNTFMKVLNKPTSSTISIPQVVTGTLPDGIVSSDLSGSVLKTTAASPSGHGGFIQTLETHDAIYKRVFSYKFSEWVKVNSIPTGGFNSAGVWVTPYGDELTGGGMVYSFTDHAFYALADDGKAVTGKAGVNTLNIGVNRSPLTVLLDNSGKINLDITSMQETKDFISNTKASIAQLENPSTQLIVTDSHGTSANDVMKTFSKTLAGYAYVIPGNTIAESDITSPNAFITREDISSMSTKYFQSVARLAVNDLSKNLKQIGDGIGVNVYSHLGDVEDGHNGSPEDEREAYEDSANAFLTSGFNMVDGNHDEQPPTFTYELASIAKTSTGEVLGQAVPGFEWARRVDTVRWAESYGKSSSYYGITDGNVEYIYLDSFEGGKLANTSGDTPAYGVYKKGGKFTKAQLDWLIARLNKVPNTSAVVINVHHLPNSSIMGNKPVGDGDDWWRGNVNPNIFFGILKAFQTSGSYAGSSEFDGMDGFDMSKYTTSVSVDFSGKPKNRVAVINYGHHHSTGHTTMSENGLFNIVQNPNMLGREWGYVGSTESVQHTIESVDVKNRKVYVARFGSADASSDKEFTLTF